MQTKADKPKGYEPSAGYRISWHPAHVSGVRPCAVARDARTCWTWRAV